MQSFYKRGIYVNRGNVFPMDIEKLIEQGIQSDKAALERLYEAYHGRMTKLCQRIVDNRQTAEELAHDALLLAFAKMDSLRDPRRFEAWLTSITTNVALRYKQRHHEPAMLSLSTLREEELLQQTEPTEEKPLPTMAELMAAVDALPKGYRQVFKLAVIEELSHKEIAEIMGIAAHSSSSQLTRAKKMLRKSLAHYWMLWLLPLLLPVAYFFLKPAGKQEELPPIIQHVTDSIEVADTIPDNEEQTDTATILHDNKPLPDPRPDKDTHVAELFPEKPIEVESKGQKWSLDLAYSGSMGEQNYSRPFTFTETEMIEVTTGEVPPIRSFDNWSDYAEALQSGVLDGDFKKQGILLKIAQNNAALPGTDMIERKTHHFMPVTFSFALKYRLTHRFGLETGLTYNRLKSESETGTGGNAVHEQQTIHYLGIPLKASYNIYNVRRWSLYGSLGAKLEVPVYAPLSTSYFVNGMKELEEKSTLHAPLQWSIGTGLGLQYNLTPHVGFFAEPSLQYYIPTGSDIETCHSEHPFTFSLPLGIRITW